jgi:hypothetical protein
VLSARERLGFRVAHSWQQNHLDRSDCRITCTFCTWLKHGQFWKIMLLHNNRHPRLGHSAQKHLGHGDEYIYRLQEISECILECTLRVNRLVTKHLSA